MDQKHIEVDRPTSPVARVISAAPCCYCNNLVKVGE